MKDLFENDEVKEVLSGTFYRGEKRASRRAPRTVKKAAKAEHYEVICISLYNEDLARLDAKVAELKQAGHRKMSRSSLIRFALDTVDTDKLPRSY